ncbi:Hypothetical predicted protein [Octopus vulgaris]|uniref:Uncharacterized protein n=1 Tax=Octopus vulgaris TaxID=6645 RepID=A0AA36ASK9_OCTVU|nr:Hypothetical predicted protein [Octopus vulgaris]
MAEEEELPLKYPSLGSGQSYDYAEPYSSFKGSRADFGRGSYSDSRKLFLQKTDKSGTKGSFNSDFVNKSGISLTTRLLSVMI